MEKLAILGGNAVFKKAIGYGHQYIDEADIKAVIEVLKSDFLTTGPKLIEAEKKLCDLTGAKHAVLIQNDTAALHAACHAAGVGPGDEVITTPITFAASANCAFYCGARPVFADIDPETYEIDPKSIEEKIAEKTKAVVAVDYTGAPVNVPLIKEICKKHNLVFIEDAAHSIGTKFNGTPVGKMADMTTFSFHPVKTVTSGEGGAILTDSDELYKSLILFRSHGITRNQDWMSKESEGGWYYEQIDLGYNYRMTEMQAALLSSQLDKLSMYTARRKQIVAKYDNAFSQMPEITIQKEYEGADTTRHLYILQLNLEKLNATRKEIYEALAAEGCGVNVHYIPTYHFPYYQKNGYKGVVCPNAEHLYERIVTIPLYYAMTDEDVANVIESVKKVISYYKK